THTPPPPGRRPRRLIGAVGASLLALSWVSFAVFPPIEAVHTAPHAPRHSAAFPCH
ncbi:CbtB domain-containing protein, partial [Pseudomonas mosselii]|uniref:CbtB domain-containing protein n=1 Tax=Pseudomonas mosselii TaxID=78327 RepID=UPI003D2A1E2C